MAAGGLWQTSTGKLLELMDEPFFYAAKWWVPAIDRDFCGPRLFTLEELNDMQVRQI